jgi:dipeptidyl aminopeptidase/acylaminoacyl peptidase
MPLYARTRPLRPSALALALVTLTLAQAAAQQTRFTVDDLLDLANANVADVTADGKFAVVTSAALRDRLGVNNSRYGDPSYIAPSVADVWVVETATGKAQKLFPDKRQLRGFRWSPDGTRLVFSILRSGRYEPVIWDRSNGKVRALVLPANRVLADGELQWSNDGKSLLIGLRDAQWGARAQQRFTALTSQPVVVQSSKEPFLAWDDLGRMRLEQKVALYDLATDKVREVVTQGLIRSYDLSGDGSFVTYQQDITKKTDYDIIGGNDNQLMLVQAAGGEPRKVIASTKGLSLLWTADGRRYAYSKDGALFVASIDDKEPRKLLGPAPREKADSAATPAPGGEQKPPADRYTAVRLSQDGSTLIASNREGLWFVDTQSGAKEQFLTVNEDDKEAPRYTVADLSPNGQQVILNFAARTSWERGIFRYDRASKQMKQLVKDGRLYSGVRLSRDGSTLIFNAAEGNRPAVTWISDPDFRSPRMIVDPPSVLRSRTLSRTALIDYYDADGKKSYGVLYYPVDYKEGTKYPVVFNIYETFFDDNFNSTINILTSNGYAVMQPSVNLEIGYPGEAWVKGVTAAANKLIEMGIADPDRLGVQGTSYGGYATNLLITQTDRFKAAINISGKVDMISFYTDSPRLGVRNIHAPEKSQDRLGATLWQAPQKYIEHSAIFAADRIKTPLLLMTGHEDPNVPERTTMEMYYALRRLGKEVEWVSYTYGGHGMPTTTADLVKDYHTRILAWYDKYLKAPAKKVAAN